jgi:AbrB family looped-hinge helix DNA binding protein
MKESKVSNIILRPKRQVTLPREICEQLGIGPGDTLEISIEDAAIIARPRKNMALESLKEIQRAFERSGITEDELQKAGSRTRQKIAGEHYDSGK